MKPKDYFNNLSAIAKKYEAMKAFFVENMSAKNVAKKYGYTISTVYTMTKTFKINLKENPEIDPFFIVPKKGRPFKKESDQLIELIIALRKKELSVPDIKAIIDTQPNFTASESYIDYILKQEGFSRLKRRTKKEKEHKELPPKLKAEKSEMIEFKTSKFSSSDIGILQFLPVIQKYKLDSLIENSSYPQTKTIDRYSSIMSFLALKLNNVRRYSKDDLWCMDRGLGMFASLNVLPKAAWFTSYSHRITRDMNVLFLKQMHTVWKENGLLNDTTNLDFTTIPYWGDDKHLENNWSGKRHHALSSMLAVIAQDQDTGIIDYGNTNVLHKNESAVVLEYLDFYKSDSPNDDSLKYLVFDSKFTNYENLAKLDEQGINFITIRRRGKNIVEQIKNIPASDWRKIRVACSGNKKRVLRVNDSKIYLKGYGKDVRQIAITGHGKIKPALIITNDFEKMTEEIVRKYARRWLVEKEISQQIEFFHLNRVSSSMVIKVDFDLTMSIVAHNIYRLFALELERYRKLDDQAIYEEFIKNSGEIEITTDEINIYLKKKRNLPEILTTMEQFSGSTYAKLSNKKIRFLPSSTT